jgi:hypothetical protein
VSWRCAYRVDGGKLMAVKLCIRLDELNSLCDQYIIDFLATRFLDKETYESCQTKGNVFIATDYEKLLDELKKIGEESK